jgi:hypothetical protein
MRTRLDNGVIKIVRTPSADSVSASSTLVTPGVGADFLRSLRSLRTRAAVPIKPTARYVQIVDLLFHYRLLTADQIQLLLFTPNNRSGCHRTLTLLVKNSWISTLPRKSVNDPYLYLLTPKSSIGNRLMKAKYGESEFRSKLSKLGSIPHLLGINEVRARVQRACLDLIFSMDNWDGAPQLQRTLGLVPDGYFLIRRQVEERQRSAGHFLELQHSIRAGTALELKLKRYSDFYYSGQYEAWAHTRGMRVLVVFTTEMGVSAQTRVERALKQAQRLGVSRARFASLDTIRLSQNILTEPIWYSAEGQAPTALYE